MRKLCLIPRCLCIVSRLPVFSVQRQMLEVIYQDIVGAFNKTFIELYSQKSSSLLPGKSLSAEIAQDLLLSAKGRIPIDRLELYVSSFLHHLRVDGTHIEIELYRKPKSPVKG
jgi:hypothetical protein